MCIALLMNINDCHVLSALFSVEFLAMINMRVAYVNMSVAYVNMRLNMRARGLFDMLGAH